MTLAFYAPMKHPNHGVPSGDRTIARSLMSALRFAGAEVSLASTFQSRDGKGNEAAQKLLLQQAGEEISRLIDLGKRENWRGWITYHNYYKAPDLLGPSVTRALGIPYAQVESTRARKRLNGPWATFAKAAETASDHADLVFYFTRHDAEALRKYAPASQKLRHLHPFLDRAAVDPSPSTGTGLLSVGMMRERDKLPSYQLIAETLHLVKTDNWTLDIIGDGPARARVADLMRPFGDKVRLLGTLPPDEVARRYGNYAVFLWPGVNEAFGMAYLEAQAASLAIVAQDRPGVCDVLPEGHYPAPDQGAAGLAAKLSGLLDEPEAMAAARQQALNNVRAHHLLPTAAQTLKAGFEDIGVAL